MPLVSARNKFGFTLIELLIVIVVIAIVAVIVFIALNPLARFQEARDSARISDVIAIRKAFELYAFDTGHYPLVADWDSGSIIATLPSGMDQTYLPFIPIAPIPADGACTDSDNTYSYSVSDDLRNYALSYCLGQNVSTIPAGFNIASEKGLTGGAVIIPPFVCGESVDYSGDSYPTEQIGAQCWMAKNLDVGTMVSGVDQTDNSAIEKYCYNDNPSDCGTYGGLYQWGEMMQYGLLAPGAQGICPNGWHIPTHDDFTTLERAVCSSGSCVTDFPFDTATIGWRGTNEGSTLRYWKFTQFNALLGGYTAGNSFFDQTVSAYFWTSSDLVGFGPWYRGLTNSGGNSGQVLRSNFDTSYGLSVRCVQN